MTRRWSWLRTRDLSGESGLFDGVFYRAVNGLAHLAPDAAADHFADTGAAQARAPHRLFDPPFYLSQTGAPSARADPLRHYLRRGWRRGLRPSAGFDPAFYSAVNPDIRIAGFEPLTHFAARGEREGREPNAGAVAPLVPSEPTEDEWERLPPRPMSRTDAVDVVMPVYAGRAETLRAIHSVLAADGATPVELVVVDDASPDTELVAHLERLAREGRITLLRHAANRGFVGAANTGIALHPTRDVILLNADVEVFGNWVDRLVAAADRDRSIGTVTPWSSDATILSYPIRLRPNGMQLEMQDRQLDALAAGLPRDPVEIPTGVGSCMLIRRACLAAVGAFDELHFGRGYGEENDFSCRARRAGWTNVAAPTVYVRHYGSRSFGAEKSARIEAGLKTLARLHPDYLPRVRRFIKADPLAPLRQLFDEARVRATAPAAILTDAAIDADNGTQNVVRLTPARGPQFGLLDLMPDRVPVTPNLPPIAPGASPDEWKRRLSALDVRSVRTAAREHPLGPILERVARACAWPIEHSA